MQFPILYLYVKDTNTKLIDLYKTAVEKHNTHVQTDEYPNSGFDLYIPSTQSIDYKEDMNGTLVDLQVKCEMKDSANSIAYYLYPRSSLSKTPLMLSHSVGIIDCGYRGFIKASLRNLHKNSYDVEFGSRLTQIVHPTMKPFLIELVSNENDLSSTTRGQGGFGSTGK